MYVVVHSFQFALKDEDFLLFVGGHGRGAEHNRVVVDIACYTGLGSNGNPVAYLDMADNAYLTGNHAVVAYLATASTTRLGSHDCVAAERDIVGDLAEIVNFGTAVDDGGAHGGTIDAGIGTDFDIVLDDYITYLVNLAIGTIALGGKSEAIGTDDDTCMKDAVVADVAFTINLYAGIEDYVVTHDTVVTDIDLGTRISPPRSAAIRT